MTKGLPVAQDMRGRLVNLGGGNWGKSAGGGGGTAANSGAILSGGTLLRGTYDFANNQAPADSNYFVFAGTNTSNDFSGGTHKITYGLNSTANVGATIRLLDVVPQDLYIEFRARMPGAAHHGLKFIKFMGENNNPVGYHNVTFGLDYNGGAVNGDLVEFSYGDGSGTTGDTAQTMSLDEAVKASNNGRNSNIIKNIPNGIWAEEDWLAAWHTFRIAMIHSSGTTLGTETADAGVYIEIDGNIYLDAGGFFSRHYSNSLGFDGIGIGGISQSAHPEFYIEYDDIKVSTGGFI